MNQNFIFGERTFHGDFYTTQDGKWTILFRRDGKFVMYKQNPDGKYDHTRIKFDSINEVNQFLAQSA